MSYPVERTADLTLDAGYVATAVFVALDPLTGTARIASAGHPPILEIRSDGVAGFVDVEKVGMPFGCDDVAVYSNTLAVLTPGSSYVLYTDGLLEDRSVSIDVGLERLRRAACNAPTGTSALCEHLIQHGSGGEMSADDTAILIVHRQPITPC